MAGCLGFLGYSFYTVSQDNTTYQHRLHVDMVSIIKANGIIKGRGRPGLQAGCPAQGGGL
jgi:hypothetical protein